jgi:hypothetical protein
MNGYEEAQYAMKQSYAAMSQAHMPTQDTAQRLSQTITGQYFVMLAEELKELHSLVDGLTRSCTLIMRPPEGVNGPVVDNQPIPTPDCAIAELTRNLLQEASGITRQMRSIMHRIAL